MKIIEEDSVVVSPSGEVAIFNYYEKYLIFLHKNINRYTISFSEMD